MKKYKIVQHFQNDTDHMFRIYQRTWCFGWEWITSYSTIEKCEEYIANLERNERERIDLINSTPKPRLVKYIG